MKVRIFKPNKTPTQSGNGNTKFWIMKIIEEENSRSISPLTGWTSSDDTKNQLQLKFQDKEEAIKYATDQGFDYEVIEPEMSVIKKKSYASNFV